MDVRVKFVSSFKWPPGITASTEQTFNLGSGECYGVLCELIAEQMSAGMPPKVTPSQVRLMFNEEPIGNMERNYNNGRLISAQIVLDGWEQQVMCARLKLSDSEFIHKVARYPLLQSDRTWADTWEFGECVHFICELYSDSCEVQLNAELEKLSSCRCPSDAFQALRIVLNEIKLSKVPTTCSTWRSTAAQWLSRYPAQPERTEVTELCLFLEKVSTRKFEDSPTGTWEGDDRFLTLVHFVDELLVAQPTRGSKSSSAALLKEVLATFRGYLYQGFASPEGALKVLKDDFD